MCWVLVVVKTRHSGRGEGVVDIGGGKGAVGRGGEMVTLWDGIC